MIIDSTPTLTEKLMQYIKSAIKDVAEEEFEKAKQEMVKRLDEHKDEVVAGIVLRFSQVMSLQDFGQYLKITIEKKTLSDDRKKTK